MGYIGKDFDPQSPAESEIFTFDFVKSIPEGESIASAIWTCTIAGNRPSPDLDPQSHIIGVPVNTGTKTSIRLEGLMDRVLYTLKARVILTDGQTVELWSNVRGRV